MRLLIRDKDERRSDFSSVHRTDREGRESRRHFPETEREVNLDFLPSTSTQGKTRFLPPPNTREVSEDSWRGVGYRVVERSET